MQKAPAAQPKKRGIIRRTLVTFADVPTWMGYRQLAEMTGSVASGIKNLFTIRKATTSESFEESVARFNLTENDIKNRIRIFSALAIFWLMASIGILFYGVYLAGNHSWHGFLACLGLSCLMLGQAFYYHFWMFQMKQRRLGCTFKEWLNANFRGGES